MKTTGSQLVLSDAMRRLLPPERPTNSFLVKRFASFCRVKLLPIWRDRDAIAELQPDVW
jgi:hypothetical protein